MTQNIENDQDSKDTFNINLKIKHKLLLTTIDEIVDLLLDTLYLRKERPYIKREYVMCNYHFPTDYIIQYNKERISKSVIQRLKNTLVSKFKFKDVPKKFCLNSTVDYKERAGHPNYNSILDYIIPIKFIYDRLFNNIKTIRDFMKMKLGLQIDNIENSKSVLTPYELLDKIKPGLLIKCENELRNGTNHTMSLSTVIKEPYFSCESLTKNSNENVTVQLDKCMIDTFNQYKDIMEILYTNIEYVYEFGDKCIEGYKLVGKEYDTCIQNIVRTNYVTENHSYESLFHAILLDNIPLTPKYSIGFVPKKTIREGLFGKIGNSEVVTFKNSSVRESEKKKDTKIIGYEEKYEDVTSSHYQCSYFCQPKYT